MRDAVTLVGVQHKVLKQVAQLSAPIEPVQVA